MVEMAVKKGDKVKVEYEGSLGDGTVFDCSTNHGKPLEFEAGAGQMIKGFDEAVIGMKNGEEKKIRIEASEAYGEHRADLVREIPKEQLPKDAEVKPGMVLGMMLPTGQKFPARVVEVTAKGARIDLNHPLAGKALNFWIKVVEVS